MEKISPLNIPLLRSIQFCILETPEQFHIGYWHCGDILPGVVDKCSASACIAGWALVLGCKVRLSELDNSAIDILAREVLGVGEIEAQRLFLLSHWPFVLRERYRYNARTVEDYRVNAQVAAWRIEIFILSDGQI